MAARQSYDILEKPEAPIKGDVQMSPSSVGVGSSMSRDVLPPAWGSNKTHPIRPDEYPSAAFISQYYGHLDLDGG